MYSTHNLLLHHFNTTPGIGSKTLRVLTQSLTPSQILNPSELETLPLNTKKIETLRVALRAFESDLCEEDLLSHDVQLLSTFDENYPSLLREIPDHPALLYIRGDSASLSSPSVAIVGTRHPSRYGLDITHTLARDLAQSGITIISGMALGLDASAHRGCLEGKGKTIAVLGSGLANRSIAPQSHLSLMKDILSCQGCIVSEYAPLVRASTGTFPARNRIIAGLSQILIVTEATQKSGTLITAQLALDYNREVLAIPGSVFSPLSGGPHALIRSGATLISGAEHVLEILGKSHIPSYTSPVQDSFNEQERHILTLLEDGPKTRLELEQESLQSATNLSIHLTTLEMNGFIRSIGSNTYRKI